MKPVRTVVVHGDRDRTVVPGHAETIATAALDPFGPTTEEEEEGTAGDRMFLRVRHRTAEGLIAVEQWTIQGAGHVWSGGAPGRGLGARWRHRRAPRSCPPVPAVDCRGCHHAGWELWDLSECDKHAGPMFYRARVLHHQQCGVSGAARRHSNGNPQASVMNFGFSVDCGPRRRAGTLGGLPRKVCRGPSGPVLAVLRTRASAPRRRRTRHRRRPGPETGAAARRVPQVRCSSCDSRFSASWNGNQVRSSTLPLSLPTKSSTSDAKASCAGGMSAIVGMDCLVPTRL